MTDQSTDVPDEITADDVVLAFRPEVRCFFNKRGEVTISTSDERGNEHVVSVPLEALRPLAARLTYLADIEDQLDEQEAKERGA
jgi:hypothetical protein